MIDFIQAAQTAAQAGEVAQAAAEEVASMGLWELFLKGGWLMWPLLILGGVTVFIFVERYMAIRKASGLDMNFMNRIRDYISDGKIRAAVDLCRKTNTPIARMIEKGIERIGRPMGDMYMLKVIGTIEKEYNYYTFDSYIVNGQSIIVNQYSETY